MGGLLKKAESEVDIKDPSEIEDSVALSSADQNNEIIREGVDDDNCAAAQKTENVKIKSFRMTDDAEDGNNFDVTNLKDKDDSMSKASSSSSSSDDSSGDDSDSTSSDS